MYVPLVDIWSSSVVFICKHQSEVYKIEVGNQAQTSCFDTVVP